MKSLLSSLVLIAFLSVSFGFEAAFAHEDESHHTLTVSDVWARKTRRTMSAAVYMTLKNDTEKMDTLLSVETPQAEMATLHLSSETDGIMRMEEQESVALQPGSTISFAPGGYHIMMMRLASPLKEGDVFPMTLSFERAGDVTVYVTVTGIAGLQK